MKKVFFTLSLLGLSLIAGCQGCGADAPPSGARWKVTEEGEGEANVAPLMPIHVGMRSPIEGLFDAEVELERGRAFRLGKPGEARVDYYYRREPGVFYGGSTEGVLEAPVLLVPATVRVGMKWHTFRKDSEEPNYRYEVTSRRADLPTRFGPRTVWKILQTDRDDAEFEREYIEGIGLSTVEFSSEDVPAVDALAVDTLELEPLALPDALRARFGKLPSLTSLSLVRPAGSAEAILMFNSPFLGVPLAESPDMAACFKTDGASISEAPMQKGGPWRQTTGHACVVTEFCGDDRYGQRVCSEYVSGQATGVHVGPDGTNTWLPRSPRGENETGDQNHTGKYTVAGLSSPAIFPALDGGAPVAIFLHQNDPLELAVGTASFERPAWESLGLVNTLDLASKVPQIPLTDATGGRRTFITPAETLAIRSLTEEGLTAPRPQGRLTGRLSVQATVDGNEVLRVTGDGAVDRLVVRNGALQLERLGEVKLPEGHLAVDAWLFRMPEGDRLLVATLEDDGSTEFIYSARLHLFRSKKTISPAPGTRPSPALGLTLVHANGGLLKRDDQLLCWPAQQGVDVDPASLRLNGLAPAMVVRPDPSLPCLLLVRAPADLGSEGRWVEGRGAGLGHFVLDDPSLEGTQPLFAGAPLKGGGWVTTRFHYGEGGVVVAPLAGLRPGGLDTAVMDQGGGGLWATHAAADGTSPFLRRYARTPTDVTFPNAMGGMDHPSITLPAQGGGVVVGTASGSFLVGHDGTKRSLPALRHPRELCGVLADGTQCGFDLNGNAPEFFCVAPDGTERTASSGGQRCDGSFLPTAFGTFFGVQQGREVHFDPTTLSLVDRGPPAFAQHVDADGHFWGVVRMGTQYRFARMTPTGWEQFEVPAELQAALTRAGGYAPMWVMPDANLLVVAYTYRSSQGSALFRIPRPQ